MAVSLSLFVVSVVVAAVLVAGAAAVPGIAQPGGALALPEQPTELTTLADGIPVTFLINVGPRRDRQKEPADELLLRVWGRTAKGATWDELFRGHIDENAILIDRKYGQVYIIGLAYRYIVDVNQKGNEVTRTKSYIYNGQIDDFNARSDYTITLKKVNDDVEKAVKKVIKRAIDRASFTVKRTKSAIKKAIEQEMEEDGGFFDAVAGYFLSTPY